MNLLIVFLVILLFAAAFVLVRTLSLVRRVEPVEAAAPADVDAAAVADHLGTVIRCRTISTGEPGHVSVQAFEDLHLALESMYPRLHAALTRRTINDFSLLYFWEGSDPHLKPVLFAAHQDVVPVTAAGLPKWQHPPFDGVIADGCVWGRGALDMKHQLVAILEAVEHLLAEGYQPRRSIYLAFGHDEEIGGAQGASQIVAWLADQGVELAAVLDEGGALMEEALPGVKTPLALVGVAEKGYLTLELAVAGESGHSSKPPPHTAIGILARALAKLEARPLKPRLASVQPFLESIAVIAPFAVRMAAANLWLFGGLVRRKLAAEPQTNAMIRTTSAITLISGGVKDNILPDKAQAAVNFRLLPGDTVAAVCEQARKTIGDERVSIQPKEGAAWDASPASPDDSPAFERLAYTIRQFFGPLPVAPYLVMGATDARYYAVLSDQVYRFAPLLISAENLNLIHGDNERISIQDLEHMVQFFVQFIRAWGEDGL